MSDSALGGSGVDEFAYSGHDHEEQLGAGFSVIEQGVLAGYPVGVGFVGAGKGIERFQTGSTERSQIFREGNGFLQQEGTVEDRLDGAVIRAPLREPVADAFAIRSGIGVRNKGVIHQIAELACDVAFGASGVSQAVQRNRTRVHASGFLACVIFIGSRTSDRVLRGATG
jgi:hypothetical protein